MGRKKPRKPQEGGRGRKKASDLNETDQQLLDSMEVAFQEGSPEVAYAILDHVTKKGDQIDSRELGMAGMESGLEAHEELQERIDAARKELLQQFLDRNLSAICETLFLPFLTSEQQQQVVEDALTCEDSDVPAEQERIEQRRRRLEAAQKNNGYSFQLDIEQAKGLNKVIKKLNTLVRAIIKAAGPRPEKDDNTSGEPIPNVEELTATEVAAESTESAIPAEAPQHELEPDAPIEEPRVFREEPQITTSSKTPQPAQEEPTAEESIAIEEEPPEEPLPRRLDRARTAWDRKKYSEFLTIVQPLFEQNHEYLDEKPELAVDMLLALENVGDEITLGMESRDHAIITLWERYLNKPPYNDHANRLRIVVRAYTRLRNRAQEAIESTPEVATTEQEAPQETAPATVEPENAPGNPENWLQHEPLTFAEEQITSSGLQGLVAQAILDKDWTTCMEKTRLVLALDNIDETNFNTLMLVIKNLDAFEDSEFCESVLNAVVPYIQDDAQAARIAMKGLETAILNGNAESALNIHGKVYMRTKDAQQPGKPSIKTSHFIPLLLKGCAIASQDPDAIAAIEQNIAIANEDHPKISSTQVIQHQLDVLTKLTEILSEKGEIEKMAREIAQFFLTYGLRSNHSANMRVATAIEGLNTTIRALLDIE